MEVKQQHLVTALGIKEAKAAWLRIQDELNHINPSAARSLKEGLEETLTPHRLKVPLQL